jgi:hypothetical protein
MKKHCRPVGIDPDRLGPRGVGIHSLRKKGTAQIAVEISFKPIAVRTSNRCTFASWLKELRATAAN